MDTGHLVRFVSRPGRRTRRRAVCLIAVAAIAVLTGAWASPELAAWLWRLHAGTPAMSAIRPVLVPPLRWLDDYYVVGDLGQGAFAIGEPRYGQCNFSYLILGTQRALLFDVGPGIRDISIVVRKLTSLPIQVLPSHLHFDHTGHLEKFTDVTLPDLPALRAQVRDGLFRPGFYQNLGFVEGFGRAPFRVDHWLEPDSQIDLGGRQLKIMSMPGHTPDSVVLFDQAANRLFAGDFIYPSEVYAFLPGADLDAYAASARRLHSTLNDQTQILGAHGCDRLPTVDVPALSRVDLNALEAALTRAATTAGRAGEGWFPRVLPVNERMSLEAKYPWMSR
jgi:hydroxyacylglutathione hydrolase